MHSNSIKKLAESFHRGEMEAFHQLHKLFGGRIRRYVSGFLSRAEIAEEITQEVFLKAFRFREKYDPTHALSTWLWTIAKNTVSDWKRKNLVPEELNESQFDSIPADTPDALETLMDRHEKKKLFRIFKGLPKFQRKLLWLRFMRHMSYEEIAHYLGVSVDAVKCGLYRARRILVPEPA